MISEGDYIALEATEAAYCALLYSLSKEDFQVSIITSKEGRLLIARHVGYEFEERAVVNALEARKPYKFADRLSGHTAAGAFKIHVPEAKQHYLNLASAQASLVWQLDNLDHKRFSETVDETIAVAKGRYLINREYGTPVVGQWIDVNLWMQEGMSQRRAGNGVRLSKGGSQRVPINWTKWGTILTGVSIVVAILLWKFT